MRLALLLVLLLAAPGWAQEYPRETQPLLPPERVLSAMGLFYLPDEPPAVVNDAPVTIDMLYVRTAGTSPATCQSIVTRFNEINRNSGVGHVTMRMVGCRLLAQPSSGSLSTDLSRLYQQADGFYDEAHAWRTELGADLTQIIIPSDSGGSAGLGYFNATAFSAFSAVVEQYSVGYMSGPHEGGHNLGLHHDRGNAGCGAAGACVGQFHFGWRGGNWRTVMAYAPGERIPYWSSPLVLCFGVPCGTVADDNARVVRQRAFVVSQFRPTVTLRKPARPVRARVESRL